MHTAAHAQVPHMRTGAEGRRRVTRGLPVVDAPLFFSFLFVQGATVEAPKGPTKSAHHWRSPCALSVRSGCARHVWLLTGRQACVVAGRQREGGRKREASIRNGRREREERRRKRRGNGAREGGRKGRGSGEREGWRDRAREREGGRERGRGGRERGREGGKT